MVWYDCRFIGFKLLFCRRRKNSTHPPSSICCSDRSIRSGLIWLMARPTFNPAGITTNLNCQGSWLEVDSITAAAYSTYALATTVGTINNAYSNGLRATIRIRIRRANTDGTTPAGWGTATSNLSLCLSVKPGATATSGHTLIADTTKSAVCFYNSTIAVASACTDLNCDGF